MSKIAILGDTSQDLNVELGKEFGIEVIPYKLQLGDREYMDQVDIDSRKFYQIMKDYDVLKTGTPSPQQVIDILDILKKEGYTDAIMLTSSSKLTGMHNVYTAIQSDYEGINFHIFDTYQISLSAGFLTIRAAQLRNEGKSVEEILSSLEKYKNDVTIFALFRTLTYIVKGGRFNKYAGLVGNLLNVHPLLKAIDGEVGVIDKKIGKIKSQNALVDAVREYIGDSKDYWIAILDGDSDEEVAEVQEKLKKEISNSTYVLRSQLTPMLGVHAGPKSVVIAVLKLDN